MIHAARARMLLALLALLCATGCPLGPSGDAPARGRE